MAEKVPKTIRLPEDETEEISDYADEHEINEADAYRRLIRAGMEQEGVRTREAHSLIRPMPVLQLLTLVLVAGLYVGAV